MIVLFSSPVITIFQRKFRVNQRLIVCRLIFTESYHLVHTSTKSLTTFVDAFARTSEHAGKRVDVLPVTVYFLGNFSPEEQGVNKSACKFARFFGRSAFRVKGAAGKTRGT